MNNTKYLIILMLAWFGCALNAAESGWQSLEIASKAFGDKRVVRVHLPAGYDESRRYPVLYLLNSAAFYRGVPAEDALYAVKRLAALEEIPPAILVAVESDNWYSETMSDPKNLTRFLIDELPASVAARYGSSGISVLVGHSYAGAYLVRHAHRLAAQFGALLAISPVFPSVDYVRASAKRLQGSEGGKGVAALRIISEAGGAVDALLLKRLLKPSDARNISLYLLDGFSHQSVFPAALNRGLLDYFSDHPFDYSAASNALNARQIRQQLAANGVKYGFSPDEKRTLQVLENMAQEYMRRECPEDALVLWQVVDSRWRHYHINRWGDRFLAEGKPDLARRTWLALTRLYPNSPFAWNKLIALADNLDDHKSMESASAGLARALEEFTVADHAMINSYAFELIAAKDFSGGLTLLQRIALQTPNEPAALENLAKGYRLAGRSEEAGRVRERLQKALGKSAPLNETPKPK